MNLEKILQQEKENLFSFYLIGGDREENKKEILNFLDKELSFQIVGNSDFFIFEGDKFLIDKAREIKKIDSKTKALDKHRIFILSFESIGIDTQNALLKILEEPSENTIFFLLVSHTRNILDTIKSRARIIENHSKKIDIEAREYLQASFTDREKISADLNKEKMQSFFNSLDLLLLEKRKEIENFAEFYKKFLSLKKFVGNKGASIKYIFTYLNIYTPILKNKK